MKLTTSVETNGVIRMPIVGETYDLPGATLCSHNDTSMLHLMFTTNNLFREIITINKYLYIWPFIIIHLDIIS